MIMARTIPPELGRSHSSVSAESDIANPALRTNLAQLRFRRCSMFPCVLADGRRQAGRKAFSPTRYDQRG
jgi:hypothetical protein